jgi:transposase
VVERTFSWLGQNKRMSKDYRRGEEAGVHNESMTVVEVLAEAHR